MIMDLNENEFNEFCQTATPEEMLKALTNGNTRGLDLLALRSLSNRRQLPSNIVNVLLFYFFKEFSNKVYDRNDLARLYDHWSSMGVRNFQQAKELSQKDIHEVLKKIK
jgi:replication initiation and membrane attachment protein DnaB